MRQFLIAIALITLICSCTNQDVTTNGKLDSALTLSRISAGNGPDSTLHVGIIRDTMAFRSYWYANIVNRKAVKHHKKKRYYYTTDSTKYCANITDSTKYYTDTLDISTLIMMVRDDTLYIPMMYHVPAIKFGGHIWIIDYAHSMISMVHQDTIGYIGNGQSFSDSVFKKPN